VKGLLEKRVKRVVLGLLMTIVGTFLLLAPQFNPLEGVVTTTERAFNDWLLQIKPVKKDERIVIVDIDERSLAEHGRWPWSRTTISDLIGIVNDQGQSKVLAFDVLFAEVEQNADQQLVERLVNDPNFYAQKESLQKIGRELNADAKLFERLKGRPIVLGFYFTTDRDGHTSGQLPPPLMQTSALVQQGWRMISWTGYGANLKQFIDVAHGGFYSPRVDSDGLVRELPLLGDFAGQTYESLSSVVLRLYLGSPVAQFTPEGLIYRTSGEQVLVPLTPEMTAVIPFEGTGGPSGGRFNYVSAVDVLKGRVSPQIFKDKIVLVGTSAPGLTDLRATPVNPSYPGVEAHASLIAGALSGTILTRSPTGTFATAGIVFLGGVLLCFFMTRRGAVGTVLTGLTAIGFMVALAFAAQTYFSWVVPFGLAIWLIGGLTFLNLVAGYAIEGRSKKAMVERFGEYVAPELVARMANDPKNYRLDSENKELTIMFTDIRGFTPIAESLPPQELREFLNRFLDVMTDIIHRHHGTVDKYIGDSIMAFWGAPVHDQAHADHAVQAALAMLLELDQLNIEFAKRGWPALRIGVGINSGIVRVGDMGSTQRRAYTAIGDAVNLASRLEQLTKVLTSPIALGRRTAELTSTVPLIHLGDHFVTGKQEAVSVFAPSQFLTTATVTPAIPEPRSSTVAPVSPNAVIAKELGDATLTETLTGQSLTSLKFANTVTRSTL
jgi:adenylate cyclase